MSSVTRRLPGDLELPTQVGTVVVAVVAVVLALDLIRKLATGEVAISQFGVFVWQGIVNGLVYGLAGIGLSMTYSILNFANFAHGDYISSGAFAGWASSWLVAGFGKFSLGGLLLVGATGEVYSSNLSINVFSTPLAVIAGIVVAGAFTVALALVLDRLVYKPMRGEGGITLLIASIGVAFMLRYLIVFVYGGSPRSVTDTPPGFSVAFEFADGTINLGYHEITLVVCAVLLMLGVHFVLQRTKLGKAMRAMSDNKDLARVTGIPTERVIRWTWIIGAGLAGIAGFLLMLESATIAWNRGWIILLFIFAAVIMGGIGSIYGAIAGGLVIGLVDTVSQVWLPSEFTQAAAFGIMVVVLLIRPQGIFSGRTTA